MIPVGRDEILSRFAETPAALETLHKLYLAITCKSFYPGKAGSLICIGTKFRNVRNLKENVKKSKQVIVG